MVRVIPGQVRRGDGLGVLQFHRALLLHLLFELLQSLPAFLLKLARLFTESPPVGLELRHHVVEILFLLKELVLLLFEKLFKVVAPLFHILQLLFFLGDLLLAFRYLGLLLLEKLIVILLLFFESFFAEAHVD